MDYEAVEACRTESRMQKFLHTTHSPERTSDMSPLLIPQQTVFSAGLLTLASHHDKASEDDNWHNSRTDPDKSLEEDNSHADPNKSSEGENWDNSLSYSSEIEDSEPDNDPMEMDVHTTCENSKISTCQCISSNTNESLDLHTFRSGNLSFSVRLD